MDIEKSQRLSQYLGVVSDMVQYTDIGISMVESGTLTPEEHELLQIKLEIEGNSLVMNEFLTMINLRRGGFDIFLKVLRKTDYIWMAEQLDPGKTLTEPRQTPLGRGNAKMQNMMANVRQTMSRKSEQSEPLLQPPDSSEINSEEFTLMSYRDSYPKLIKVKDENEKCERLATTVGEPLEMNDITAELINLELDSDGRMLNKIVLVKNVPTSQKESPVDYFTTLAKRLEIPANLKVICHGKISKIGRKRKVNKVKLQFQTEDARNRFIASFKELVVNLEPSDELYKSAKQLNLSVPQANDRRGDLGSWLGRGSLNKLLTSSRSDSVTNAYQPESEMKIIKKHWYQRGLCLKSWRNEKD